MCGRDWLPRFADAGAKEQPGACPHDQIWAALEIWIHSKVAEFVAAQRLRAEPRLPTGMHHCRGASCLRVDIVRVSRAAGRPLSGCCWSRKRRILSPRRCLAHYSAGYPARFRLVFLTFSHSFGFRFRLRITGL